MKMKSFCAALFCVLFGATAASAATIGYTEGARTQVAGTTALGDVASAPPGFDLGGLGFGVGENSVIDVYGRIVGAVDTYSFSASSAFRIDFIFGGYDLEGGGSVAQSGFVQDGPPGSSTNITLSTLNGLVTFAIGNPIMTDITGGASLLFTATAGDYVLMLDGLTSAGLYDIRITAVPVPAALPLFLAGLGGLGWLRRRQKRAA